MELLGILGLSLLSFKRLRFTSTMAGAYRKLISFPHDLKWEISTTPHLTTPTTMPTSSTCQPCVNLDFKLDPGSYVTTMMHELLIK